MCCQTLGRSGTTLTVAALTPASRVNQVGGSVPSVRNSTASEEAIFRRVTRRRYSTPKDKEQGTRTSVSNSITRIFRIGLLVSRMIPTAVHRIPGRTASASPAWRVQPLTDLYIATSQRTRSLSNGFRPPTARRSQDRPPADCDSACSKLCRRIFATLGQDLPSG